MDTDAHTVRDMEGKLINDDKPIIIGNHVWIGCRSLVLKGTEIADNNIIAAQSVLNKKYLGTNCIFAGHPAIVVKQNIAW